MASRGPYSRRKRDAWQPSDRQRHVLDLLVEGKTNAEIAETLAITADGVKWHISELLGVAGLDDRWALARWWQAQCERRRQPAHLPAWLVQARHVWPALGVAVALVAIVLVGLTSGRDGHDEPAPNPQAVADFAPSLTSPPTPKTTVDPGPPPPCDTPLPGGFRGVTAEELRAEGLVELGRIVEPRSCPLQVANRADLSFLWLADGGEIKLEEAGLHRVGAFGPYYRGSNYLPSDLGFYFNGEQFRVAIWLQDQGRPVFVGTEAPNAEVEVTGGGRIQINRVGSEGAFASVSVEGERSGRHRLAFASDGTLFFDPNPLPGELATNRTTGESIDVSRMTPLGQIEFTPTGYPDSPRTACGGTPYVCSVGLPAISQPIKLRAGGEITCVPVMSAGVEREGYEFDTGAYVLRFEPAGGYGVPWNGGCTTFPAWRDSLSHSIAPRAELYVWTYTSIAAFHADGTPVSLVITRDGHLYMGDVTLEFDCPCAIGN